MVVYFDDPSTEGEDIDRQESHYCGLLATGLAKAQLAPDLVTDINLKE